MKKQTLINLFKYPFRYRNTSFSQEGEDLILQRIFENKTDGFFVDVGAHHPIRFSNTYLFYLKGWRGINIDAMPGSMKLFNKVRPKDINIECPVSEKEEELVYYIFNEFALNTFSAEEAHKKDGIDNYKIIAKKRLQTKTLANILATHVNANQVIDFLSIDVEGLDIQVLRSIDWAVCKPKIILIEELIRDLDLILTNSDVNSFLKLKGYKLFAKTMNTLFFKLAE